MSSSRISTRKSDGGAGKKETQEALEVVLGGRTGGGVYIRTGQLRVEIWNANFEYRIIRKSEC